MILMVAIIARTCYRWKKVMNHGPWDFGGVDEGSAYGCVKNKVIAGWWFQPVLIFNNIWDNPKPIDFHMFQRGRSTTNQLGM